MNEGDGSPPEQAGEDDTAAAAERRRVVEALFADALQVAEGDRTAWLARSIADESVRHEVESLLSAAGRRGLFDELEEEIGAVLLGGVPPQTPAGDRVGPYRLVRLLGSGGMGSVYLAEREDADFEQRVAIKVARAEPGSTLLEEKFIDERKILASLEHPGIARFIDGGWMEPAVGRPERQPYIVMEYVEGEPITRHADRVRLPVRERLELFRQVCTAVHHAHTHLVVHRDLKPSNVLVTPEGDPKLLDFGVARLLGEGGGSAPLTRTGARRLTPEYAAPELVLGEPATTAADVYSLGVLLYELLSGRRPFDLTSLTAADMERVISTEEPRPPSTAVGAGLGTAEGQPAPAEVARLRGEPLSRLERLLAGDLDVIVLRAMAKDPARRYSSAAALSQDVARFLEGLPIEARRDSRTYRFRRFVGRNRTAVAGTGLLIVSLVAGIIGTTSQARRAARAAALARAEASKALQTSALIAGLFEEADPSIALGDTLTVFELLAEGTRRVERDLVGVPDVQAELLGVLGRSYLAIGDYETARRLLERVAGLREGATAVDRVTALRDLGQLHYELSEHAAADSLLDTALATAERLPPEDHRLVAEVLELIGKTHGDRGDWEGAEGFFASALETRKTLVGESQMEVAAALVGLGDVAAARGERERADGFYREALDAERTLKGEGHPDVAAILYSVGRSRMMRSDWSGGAEYIEQALGLYRTVYGPDHRRTSTALVALAAAYREIGDLARADSLYAIVIPLQRRLYGGDHVVLAHTLHNRGLLAGDLSAPADIERFLDEALAMRVRLFGADHPFIFATHRARAFAYQTMGDERAAEAAFRLALSEGERIFGPDDGAIGSLFYDRGRFLLEHERPVEAEAVLNRALSLLEDRFGVGHPQAALAQIDVGRALLRQGRFEQAEAALLTAYPVVIDGFSRDPPTVTDATEAMIELYDAWGRPDRADAYRQAAGAGG